MKTLNSHGRKDRIVININIDDFAQEFFEILKKKLSESYIFHYKTEGNKFSFKGSIFRFAWNGWNLFNTISQGEVDFLIENENPYICHKINFTEIFTIALIFNIIPLFALKFEPSWSLFIFLAIWFVYAVVYLVTIFRFNSYISETLIAVNKTTGYELHKSQEGIG